MDRKYANPPIIEAVCEFRLASETDWDLTVPGRAYEQLRKDFPHSERRVVQDTEIHQDGEGVKHEVRMSERAVLLTEDRKSFVQLGPHVLAINRLRPYQGWAEFVPQIELAFSTLGALVDITGLERIGLRYINQIDIRGERVDLEKYFEFNPHLGQELPQDLVSFVVGAELEFAGERDRCRLQLTTALTERDDHSGFLLDLDYFVAKPSTVAVDEALAWVNEAHENIASAFEGCITDELRELLGEVD